MARDMSNDKYFKRHKQRTLKICNRYEIHETVLVDKQHGYMN